MDCTITSKDRKLVYGEWGFRWESGCVQPRNPQDMVQRPSRRFGKSPPTSHRLPLPEQLGAAWWAGPRHDMLGSAPHIHRSQSCHAHRHLIFPGVFHSLLGITHHSQYLGPETQLLLRGPEIWVPAVRPKSQYHYLDINHVCRNLATNRARRA
jgi:hypothetical protein